MTRPAAPPPFLTITVQVPSHCAPALRSLVLEISDAAAAKLDARNRLAKEEAVTRGIAAIGCLRAAICAAIPAGDPFVA